MPTLIITDHAAKRIKERLGLPKSAITPHVHRAYNEGWRHSHAHGKAKRFIDKLFLSHGNASDIRIYGRFVFLFNGQVLITVVPLPRSMINGFKKENQ